MTNNDQLHPQTPAPEVVLSNDKGERVSLSNYKGQKTLIVFFMRAFNCMQCRQFVKKMAENAPPLAAKNIQSIVIGPGTRQEAERLVRSLNTPPELVVLHDTDGEAYNTFSLDKAFLSLVQKSGLFLIDQEGILQSAIITANANRWISGRALEDLKKELANT
ncbi:MAG TPA: redoxin domain-containing protein [Aggregatilineales bacterium]|nr:redoxin domain-containing protein [Anaerolineales bacterium]HRE49115.1 redoxin domain-containing protein [Aggregatilineales bacterium]